MVTKTVDQVVAKWAQNTQNATTYMKQGVQNVTTNPMDKAAAALPKALANYNARVNDGSMAAKMKAVTLPQWQDAMINKGIPRVAQGVTSAVPKTTTAFGKLLPYIDKGQKIVESMPNTSLVDSKARMNAFFDHMAAYPKS
jgi:hypothetical protein